jgi:8-oxo-dGTP diphosphatase
METLQRPLIGIGIYILNDEGEVLLGKRKGSHGAGEFAPPGGHLEFGESFEEAARKEVREETGLEIGSIELFYVSNDRGYIESSRKHYVTLAFRARYLGGDPIVLEPEKCERWQWYSLDQLPDSVASFCSHALAQLRSDPSAILTNE